MITQTGLLHTHVVEIIIQQMLVTVVCEARFDHSLHNAQIFTAAPVYSGIRYQELTQLSQWHPPVSRILHQLREIDYDQKHDQSNQPPWGCHTKLFVDPIDGALNLRFSLVP